MYGSCASYISLEYSDWFASHYNSGDLGTSVRLCATGGAVGPCSSSIVVSLFIAKAFVCRASFLGRMQIRAALAIRFPLSSLIALVCSLPGRIITPFLRVGRRGHLGAVAGCGPKQFAHLGGHV